MDFFFSKTMYFKSNFKYNFKDVIKITINQKKCY